MGLIPTEPPPGPARPGFWTSPIRGAWLTTMIGFALLAAVVLVAVTGWLSHSAYQPDLGSNAIVPTDRDLPVIGWPAGPTSLYALTQGIHVTVGLVLVPLVLFKLWSVIPLLFHWPPPTNPAEALQKLANLVLVGSAIFQLATGVTNAQLYYPWHFNFVVAHYYGAWIFLAALALHVLLMLPRIRGALRARDGVLELADDPLRSPNPGPTTITRRWALGLMGGASGAVALTTVGQSTGGVLRDIAVFAPRGRGEEFPVNKTAAVANVTPDMVDDGWRLELRSAAGGSASLTREELLAMPLVTADLPIACVEGWSSLQEWTGVRLADLAALVDAPDARQVRVLSLQPRGAFNDVTLGRAQIAADRGMLALRVNGADLPLDHGYPARVICPALPGVHCTKWVSQMEFA